MAIENPLINVHGDTATSQVIFTEYRQEKLRDPMKMTTQGKEYATWVKVNGQWLYKTRQIASGCNPPEGWKEQAPARWMLWRPNRSAQVPRGWSASAGRERRFWSGADLAGLNGQGPAEPSYMKQRTAGHTGTAISLLSESRYPRLL